MSSNIGVSEDNSCHAFSETRKTLTNEKTSEEHSIPSNSNRKKKKLYLDPKYKHGRWTDKEHMDFIRGIFKLGKNNWKKLEEEIPSRTSTQIRSHAQKFLVKLLKKYNVLNHKRSAYVSKELFLRRDIEPKDKYIIEVLNHYRRKMNFLNSLRTTKIEREDSRCNFMLNQINNENEEIFFKRLNWNQTLFYIKNPDFHSESNKLYFNPIKNKAFESQSSVVSSLENLININSHFINNFYEKRNHYDFDCIQNQINQLAYEFRMQYK